MMEDKDRSKEQLFHELGELRRRVSALEDEKVHSKQADDVLIAEKNKLKSLVDSLEYGVTIQDRKYNIIFQNKMMSDMFGQIGEKCYRIYEFGEGVCEGCPAELVFQDGATHGSERKVLMPTGETIIWENTAIPLKDAGGNITGCIEIVRDITKRKQEEQAIRESEEKYGSIFENAVEGIYQNTPEGQYTAVNPALARMMGYGTPEEMIMSFTDAGRQLFVNSEDRERYNMIVEEKGVINGFEAQVHRKDGSTMWTSTNGRSVKDAAGRTVYHEGMVEDITLRKNVEQRLMESEERYRTAIEFSNDGVSLLRGAVI